RIAAVFLVVNGIILYAGERFRTRKSREADEQAAKEREQEPALVGAGRVGGAHSSGQRAIRQQEIASAMHADRRLASLSYMHADRRLTSFSYWQAIIIGSAQILALLAGISRDGVTMVAGMFRGLSREDAARFAFLLATPVILAAGVLKIPDLLGPLGNGVRPQILAGSIVSGVAAYLSVRFL